MVIVIRTRPENLGADTGVRIRFLVEFYIFFAFFGIEKKYRLFNLHNNLGTEQDM